MYFWKVDVLQLRENLFFAIYFWNVDFVAFKGKQHLFFLAPHSPGNVWLYFLRCLVHFVHKNGMQNDRVSKMAIAVNWRQRFFRICW